MPQPSRAKQQTLQIKFWLFGLEVSYFVVNYVPAPIWKLMVLIFDVFMFWFRKVYDVLSGRSATSRYKQDLQNAQSLEEWSYVASRLDSISGGELWRQNFISNKYDYKLISERLHSLRNARESKDFPHLLTLLRSSLLRNFGGIAEKELYTRAYSGTKTLIETYVAEILKCLIFINDFEYKDDFTNTVNSFNQLKLDFFHDVRQTYGSTALILQGGSLFGLCHIGVIKAMYFKGLLPRIISGSGVGAVVAAFVCCLIDDHLLSHLVTLSKQMANLPDEVLDKRSGKVVENVVVRGFSEDTLNFMKYTKSTIKHLTFEEAYLSTGKVLNIMVHPTNSSAPFLLNYITTPNVMIISALYCSMGSGVLVENAHLYVKDINGEIKPMDYPEPCIFMTPHEANTYMGVTYTRLTELFNVNHFIVSLARPYLAALVGNGLRHSSTWYPKRVLRTVMGLELQHRIDMLNRSGLLFGFIKRLAVDDKTPTTSTSEITIVPHLRTLVKDFTRIFDVSRSNENIPYWILVGERSVWPLFPILWTRTAIEFTLDDLYNNQRKMR
ncbi:Lipase 3 [Komagataella phaffii CBS 7435]|uniref:Triacylglycerol lipase of the lipid particle, responsible for all the TAG lipase activity of the lip n=2 Tax=Komagataella phaffii TaxID=460519 RepID=C4R069_KOMPG|nr:Triacylglycerol lipase of the lipid particle, responsible for all the TAG lipase activity of the lip [Komagataella phaffii GS115]CAH2448604.1 Lipase 3 [Komagataella phaffii CBS 7435]CAY68893.1 Triacylglycerol lipase of the lipid particle, responsible for all the TAG lipase activity of the lip [Komagataella phaffii GS115]CCA38705.2 Lipase 3 [Komagataella phaffii CBS 7435]